MLWVVVACVVVAIDVDALAPAIVVVDANDIDAIVVAEKKKKYRNPLQEGM